MRRFVKILLRFILALTGWLVYSLLLWGLLSPLPETTMLYASGFLSMGGLFIAIGLAGKSLVTRR